MPTYVLNCRIVVIARISESGGAALDVLAGRSSHSWRHRETMKPTRRPNGEAAAANITERIQQVSFGVKRATSSNVVYYSKRHLQYARNT